MKRGGAAQRSFSLKQRWEVQLATQLTDFRVFTFQSFSVLLEPCVCFFVVQFQVEIVSRRCSRLVQVSGRMRHCVRDVTRVQSTITVALHLRWLLRRAAVAVLEAVHYHSSAPQSRKINRTEYSELFTPFILGRYNSSEKVNVCLCDTADKCLLYYTGTVKILSDDSRRVTNAAFKTIRVSRL